MITINFGLNIIDYLIWAKKFIIIKQFFKNSVVNHFVYVSFKSFLNCGIVIESDAPGSILRW